MRLYSFALVVLMALLPVEPSIASSRIGILIVGQNSQEAEMQELVRQVQSERRLQGYTAEQISVVGYHFDNPAERRFCEQRLQISQQDLLFLGVVEMTAAGLPIKVVFRSPGVEAGAAAAGAALYHASTLVPHTRQPSQNDTMAAARAAISGIYDKVLAAIQARDVDSMMRYALPEYTCRYRNGKTANYQQLYEMNRVLAAHEDRVVGNFRITGMKLYGKTAIVTLETRMAGTLHDDAGNHHSMGQSGTYIDTWIETSQGWRQKKSEEVSSTSEIDGRKQ